MCVCIYIYIYIYIYLFNVTSRLPPPLLSSAPRPLTPPFTRLPTGVGVWERRGAETARSGGVWWGTPEVNEASSPPLLYAKRASPQETGLLPVHAPALPEPWAARPVVRTRTAPAIQLTGQDAGAFIPRKRHGSGGRSCQRKPLPPCAPDLSGERVRPPDSAPSLDPLLLNTAHRSLTPQHDEDTRFPVYFGRFIFY